MGTKTTEQFATAEAAREGNGTREELNKLIDSALNALEEKAVFALRQLGNQRAETQMAINAAPKPRVYATFGARPGARMSAIMEMKDTSQLSPQVKGRNIPEIERAGNSIMRLYGLREEKKRLKSGIFCFENAPSDTEELMKAIRDAISGIIFALDKFPSKFLGRNGDTEDEKFFAAAKKSALDKEFPPCAVMALIDYIRNLSSFIFLDNKKTNGPSKRPTEEVLKRISEAAEKGETIYNEKRYRDQFGEGLTHDLMLMATQMLCVDRKLARVYLKEGSSKCYFISPALAAERLKKGRIKPTGNKANGHNFVVR
jgi:hypothetical protein